MNADSLSLFRHAGFARRLAQSLVSDPNSADDLVQETWLAILRRPPREEARLRSYIETTLRRAAIGSARGERRRVRREESVARSEATPSSVELAQSMELHRRIVEALLQLPEPTREVIFQRFFEDLPPREIARRIGVPVETVRTRLKRGLAALRARLDEREGGREAWTALLLPLSGSRLGIGATAMATGAALMIVKTVLVGGAAVILCLLTLQALDGEGRELAVDEGGAAPERPIGDLEVPQGERVAAAGVDPEERQAQGEAKPERVTSAPDEQLPPARPSILRVVDARTGMDLTNVTVLQGIRHTRNALHPEPWSEPNVFASAASSPIELASQESAESWWVHAPGYRWGWLRFDHDVGGERRIALEPGAAELEVRLEGFSPDLNLWVHLFPEGGGDSPGGLATVRRPVSSRLHFRGLPPRRVQVRAELGLWLESPHLLDSEEIELLPGVKNEVVLDLQEHLALEEPVPFAGRIVLPAAHPDLDLEFVIGPTPDAAKRQGDVLRSKAMPLEHVSGQPRVRRFESSGVTPGRYALVSSPLQLYLPFEVGPRGARDVLIELPELAEVRARVVDELTGERLSRGRLDWGRGRPRGLFAWTLASVEPDPETEEFVFLAPLGRLSFSTSWDDYSSAAGGIDVTSGSQVVELRVRRLPSARLQFVDRGASVPIESSWSIEVAPTVGSAKARRARIEQGRAWISAEAAGTYIVTFGEIPGYEPILPRTIEVVEGEPNELTIELHRR